MTDVASPDCAVGKEIAGGEQKGWQMVPARRLRLLSTLLNAPGEESLDVVALLAKEADWLAGPLGEVRATPLGQWQAEHTRLFVNGFPRTACPPFASAYVQGAMNSASAAKATDFYARLGLVPTPGLPADYLGTLLECAAYLADGGVAAAEETRAAFWDQLLQPWLPRFANDLRSSARMQIYRALGAELAALP